MTPEKGSYRSVYSAIWDDPEFQAFSPIALTVFFCLRTAKDCNFPCIFPHYHATLYERIPTAEPRTIDEGIEALIQAGWIRYERPVLWIVKGLKNEPNYVPHNRNHVLGISNILKSLPKLKIVEEFATYYRIPYGANGVSIPHPDTPPNQGKGKVEGKEKEKKPKKESASFVIPAIIDVNVWAAFEEHRRKLRKPMTDHARDLIVKEIMKLGQDPDELLEQSIRKGWQDVFPLKEAPAAVAGAAPEGKPKHLCVQDGCDKVGVVGQGGRMFCRKHDPFYEGSPS